MIGAQGKVNTHEKITPVLGEPRTITCIRCSEPALMAATIYALTSQDSRIIGGWAVCEACGWSPYGPPTTLP